MFSIPLHKRHRVANLWRNV